MRQTRWNKSLRLALLTLGLVAVSSARPWDVLAQAPAPSKGVKFATISPADLKTWLTYLSSDELQGREVFTEGYGLAASYIAERIREFGLKPLGANGTYFEPVKYVSYKVTRNSSVTVEVNGQSKTFKHGDHVTFPVASGGKQNLTFSGVEFAGYAMVSLNSQPPYNDFAGRDMKGKLVIWLPGTPSILTAGQAGGGRGGGGANRANYILQTLGAGGVLGFAAAPAAVVPSPADEALAKAQAALAQAAQAVADAQVASLQAQRGGGAGRAGGGGAGRGGGAGGGGRGAAAPAVLADITTVQKVDAPVPPSFTADETFFDFLFSAAPSKFADLRARATQGQALAPMTLANVKVTVNIDNTFDVISTQLTKNVVGMIEGTDPKLKDTYVMFGAHLDHVGYTTNNQAKGRVNNPIDQDKIWNGADDDGTGSTAMLGIAQAFAKGIRPKRSVVFVWHAGEEAGLLGSRYNADFPVVPNEKIQCQLNIDMIGRNRDNDPTQSNSVFVIGADRISTDLHNLVVDTNATLAAPVKLDYEYNDPNDPNTFYTRSDHYSYAVKGIPIAFFFTGTHPDYHANSDTVEKILFDKQAHIAQLVYEIGFNAANTEKVLERDNLGPRAGKGFEGKIKR